MQAYREFFARFVVRSAGSSSERLISAFSTVPREHYVGNGPWQVFVGSGYIETISDDPRLLYQDILIGLAPDRGINNGQPSLHARCLAACDPAEGEAVIHVGAGSGYYTAVLAALVGPAGSVVAYEIEPDLADGARRNLRHLTTVQIVAASATEAALSAADVIYVNAGATHPLQAWLEALSIGGRLLLPLMPNQGFGIMLLVTRRAAHTYSATAVCRASFIPCIGARDDATSAALSAALEAQSIHRIASLRIGSEPDSSAWCAGKGWWLSTAGAK